MIDISDTAPYKSVQSDMNRARPWDGPDPSDAEEYLAAILNKELAYLGIKSYTVANAPAQLSVTPGKPIILLLPDGDDDTDPRGSNQGSYGARVTLRHFVNLWAVLASVEVPPTNRFVARQSRDLTVELRRIVKANLLLPDFDGKDSLIFPVDVGRANLVARPWGSAGTPPNERPASWRVLEMPLQIDIIKWMETAAHVSG